MLQWLFKRLILIGKGFILDGNCILTDIDYKYKLIISVYHLTR